MFYSSVEPHASLGTQKGCSGADDNLASTGRKAYAGDGITSGATTTHATRRTLCAWTDADGPLAMALAELTVTGLLPLDVQVLSVTARKKVDLRSHTRA